MAMSSLKYITTHTYSNIPEIKKPLSIKKTMSLENVRFDYKPI